MAWKYVMFENSEGHLFPVIFPDKLVHADVAVNLRRLIPGKAWGKPVSAGKIDGISVRNLYGNSETLNLKSKLSDASVIEVYQYQHGIVK